MFEIGAGPSGSLLTDARNGSPLRAALTAACSIAAVSQRSPEADASISTIARFRFVLIERDEFQGTQAQQKKVYLVDLRRVGADGFLEKRLVLDLLTIPDPDGSSLPARPGELGVGDPFAFPLQSVESLAVLNGERILIANDNNYPSSDGRWVGRDRPDDIEMIVVRVPALR